MAIKILFFSAREFGQPGTTGTYKFIQELSQFYTVRVVSGRPGENSVHSARDVPLLPLEQGSDAYLKRLAQVEPAIRQFAPDVIYVFQSTATYQVLGRLKQLVPSARIIIDVKTPFLQQDPERRQVVQRQGDRIIKLVDRVITLASSSADTWFTRPLAESLVYPLAIDVDAIPQRASKRRAGTELKHWVFASALHPQRNIAELLKGFSLFLHANPGAAVLHIYGYGPNQPVLQEYARSLGLIEEVRFHGLVPQAVLHRTLASFDAGIGWVPKDVFDDSPSLKVLEYAAAGLPVLATSTKAHLQLREEGFRFEYCNDDAEGLVAGFKRLLANGEALEAVDCNVNAVRRRSFSRVLRDHIIPIIEDLGGSVPVQKALVPSRSPVYSDAGRDAERDQEKPPHRMMFIIEHLAEGKGGAERVASELACEMACRGHMVYLAYQDLGDPAYPVIDKVVLLPFKNIKDLRTILEGADLDVMTVFYFNRDVLSYVKLAEVVGVPLVLQECTNPDRLRFRNWGEMIGLSKARAAWERELATSAASRLRLVMPGYSSSFSAFQQPQVRAMPNSCARTSVQARPDHTSDGRWRILMLNGFKPNKNLKDAVAAFARLAHKYPDWVLRIVGKAPQWEAKFAREVAGILDENGLWERVEILEPTDDIEHEFATAHIHLISSLSEGCPTVVLEAMAVGLPSVGFADCPGTNELIRHQENGLLATAEDRVAGLATALDRLMSDNSYRRELGARARECAAHFDPQQIYDQWEALLKEAAEYRENPDLLFNEQYTIDPERALHVRRMRRQILEKQ